MKKEFYTVTEVSKRLNLSKPMIYKLINEGKLKKTSIKGAVRIKDTDLDAYEELSRGIR